MSLATPNPGFVEVSGDSPLGKVVRVGICSFFRVTGGRLEQASRIHALCVSNFSLSLFVILSGQHCKNFFCFDNTYVCLCDVCTIGSTHQYHVRARVLLLLSQKMLAHAAIPDPLYFDMPKSSVRAVFFARCEFRASVLNHNDVHDLIRSELRHPWPNHDDVHGRIRSHKRASILEPSDVHGLIRSEKSTSGPNS